MDGGHAVPAALYRVRGRVCFCALAVCLVPIFVCFCCALCACLWVSGCRVLRACVLRVVVRLLRIEWRQARNHFFAIYMMMVMMVK